LSLVGSIIRGLNQTLASRNPEKRAQTSGNPFCDKLLTLSPG
jgi:hypothetical protein